MPRVSVNRKKYKLADLQIWIISQMHVKELNQAFVAKELGISQQALSLRLKPIKDKKKEGVKDSFSYGDLLTLFKLFDTPEEDRLRLMRM